MLFLIELQLYRRAKLQLDKQTPVQNLSNKLTRGSIRYDEVKEIATIIGMEIEWIRFEEN